MNFIYSELTSVNSLNDLIDRVEQLENDIPKKYIKTATVDSTQKVLTLTLIDNGSESTLEYNPTIVD